MTWFGSGHGIPGGHSPQGMTPIYRRTGFDYTFLMAAGAGGLVFGLHKESSSLIGLYRCTGVNANTPNTSAVWSKVGDLPLVNTFPDGRCQNIVKVGAGVGNNANFIANPTTNATIGTVGLGTGPARQYCWWDGSPPVPSGSTVTLLYQARNLPGIVYGGPGSINITIKLVVP